MAGFECSDQLNNRGHRVDLLNMTGHPDYLAQDYDLALKSGMKTVREGIQWSIAEKEAGKYDFSYLLKAQTIAKEKGMQIIWDICHFGYPSDLTPLHPLFASRFASFCRAFTLFFKEHFPGERLIVIPINEVSFISWLGGDVRGTSPYCFNLGFDCKYHLMKAFIAGTKEIKDVMPEALIMTSEPLISIVAEDPVNAGPALGNHEAQFQSMDILTGRICPELGGSPDYPDIMGLNYYFMNQWTLEHHVALDWKEEIPGWRPLSDLLKEVHERYGLPMVITETSHPTEDRALWIKKASREIARAIELPLPLLGTCIYPFIDRPDWDDTDHWHHSGVYDIHDLDTLERVPCHEYIAAIKESAAQIDSALVKSGMLFTSQPVLVSPI